jgi:hypothetical protein
VTWSTPAPAPSLTPTPPPLPPSLTPPYLRFFLPVSSPFFADATGSCSNFRGNGLCTNCEYNAAGSICEHNICRESALARTSAVVNSYENEPGDFDWSQYNPLPVKVVQTSPNGKIFYWQMQWYPSSPDIKDYTIFADGASVVTIESHPNGCDVNGKPEMATYLFTDSSRLLTSNNKVGERTRQFSLRSNWQESLKPTTCGKWNDLERCDGGDVSRVAPEYQPDVRAPTSPIPSNHTTIDTSRYHRQCAATTKFHPPHKIPRAATTDHQH